MSEIKKPDVVDAETVIEVPSATALAVLSTAEFDMQVATAKRYPRTLSKVVEEILEMACLDEETAGQMFYALPRDGKRIEGPSVRMAEVAASAYGNLHVLVRPVAVEEKVVRVQAIAWDLEKNFRVGEEVTRRITYSDTGKRAGQRYSDDMIVTTQQAGCSIAFRNATLRVVPRALVKKALDAAKQVSIGKGLSMEQRRQRAVDFFLKLGVKVEDMLVLVQQRSVDDLSIEDLVTLQGVRTALKDGDLTKDQLLAEVAHLRGQGADAAKVVRPGEFTAAAMAGAKVSGQNDAPRPPEPAGTAGSPPAPTTAAAPPTPRARRSRGPQAVATAPPAGNQATPPASEAPAGAQATDEQAPATAQPAPHQGEEAPEAHTLWDNQP